MLSRPKLVFEPKPIDEDMDAYIKAAISTDVSNAEPQNENLADTKSVEPAIPKLTDKVAGNVVAETKAPAQQKTHQSYQQIDQPDVQHKADSKAGGQGRAIIRLNGRVGTIDRRLEKAETHIQHLLFNRIGYKELGLTLVLALLMFTSAVLAIRELFPSSHTGEMDTQLMQHINQIEDEAKKQQSLSLLAAMDSNPNLQSWAMMQLNPTNKLTQQEYRWPLEKNKNLEKLSYSQYKHGIHINAVLGDPVVAMADGKVIYSGNAINSYGNLILIEHDHEVISVYGNNYSNYVKEGEAVKQGQLIAAVGESTSQKSRLYFEIRFQGKAQDPFLYFQKQ